MSAVAFCGRTAAAEPGVMPMAIGSGVGITARQGRLSGRPSCRIFPLGKGWGLELERTSAWLLGLPLPGNFKFFKSLVAAIGFAEANDLDYRIVRPLRTSQDRFRRRPTWVRPRGRSRRAGASLC